MRGNSRDPAYYSCLKGLTTFNSGIVWGHLIRNATLIHKHPQQPFPFQIKSPHTSPHIPSLCTCPSLVITANMCFTLFTFFTMCPQHNPLSALDIRANTEKAQEGSDLVHVGHCYHLGEGVVIVKKKGAHLCVCCLYFMMIKHLVPLSVEPFQNESISSATSSQNATFCSCRFWHGLAKCLFFFYYKLDECDLMGKDRLSDHVNGVYAEDKINVYIQILNCILI